MSKIPAVKGTRDLYPQDYAPIRIIMDAWRETSLRHGFEQWDGPTLEYLDLYREKSGDELVGQLYRLTDSGDRELALRPEMTPTLARMVAAKINAMAKPIKWFCISNLFRGENVQRGRLREFLQWNIDVIGSRESAADAEVIAIGVEALRVLGLTHQDFAVHISNRRLVRAILLAAKIPEIDHGGAYAIMDKAAKLDRAELSRRWGVAYGDHLSFESLDALLDAEDLESLQTAVTRSVGASAEMDAAVEDTSRLFHILYNYGISEYCKLDLHVVRGLAYYTGPVFEFYDRSEAERAICGGGRYDDLLGKIGKSSEPAVGFGMGDVVLTLILRERNLLPPYKRGADVWVADAAANLRDQVYRLAAILRRAGIRTEFAYDAMPLARQLKIADKSGIRCIVILGDELATRGVVRVKEMAKGREREVALKLLEAGPREVLFGKP